MKLSRHIVPRYLDLVQFGPVSQVNILAQPIRAESKDDPAGIARECQAIADFYRLPVVFACETSAGSSQHTFTPIP